MTNIVTALSTALVVGMATDAHSQLEKPQWIAEWEDGHSHGCTIEQAHQLTPPALFGRARSCLENERTEGLSTLITLAHLHLRFDAIRTTELDTKLRQDLKKKLWEEVELQQQRGIKRHFGTGEFEICQIAAKAGPPDYFPSYLLDAGQAAKTGIALADLMRERIDVQEAWAELTSSKRCSMAGKVDLQTPPKFLQFEPIESASIRCVFSGFAQKLTPSPGTNPDAQVTRDFVVDVNKERTIDIGRIRLNAKFNSTGGPLPGSMFILQAHDADQLLAYAVYRFESEMPVNQFDSFTGKITLIPPGAKTAWDVSCSTVE